MPLLEFLCYLPASFCSSLSLSFHLPPSFLSISVFSSAGLVLTISETASFISSLTLFDPFDPFVFCGLCLSLFLTFGICDFSVMFCGLYSNFYFSKAEMRKRTEREKRKKGRQSESRTVRLPRKSVPCCPLHLPLLPFCLSLRALSLLPLFFFCFPGVYCHWCVFVCLCTCTIVPLCVCVSMRIHAQGKTLKVGPLTSDPLLLLNSPWQKPSRKADSAAHTQKKEKKEQEMKNRVEKESREGGQGQL